MQTTTGRPGCAWLQLERPRRCQSLPCSSRHKLEKKACSALLHEQVSALGAQTAHSRCLGGCHCHQRLLPACLHRCAGPDPGELGLPAH